MKKTLIFAALSLICYVGLSQKRDTIFLPKAKVDTPCHDRAIIEDIIEKIVSVTVYHPTSSQCDKTPLVTASGKKINPRNPHSHRWIAISWDLLKEFPFGTAVMIEGTVIYDGVYYVQDLMAKRWKSKIDILVGRKQKQISMKDVKLTKIGKL